MKKEMITLDGKVNGFAIHDAATDSFVTNKSGAIVLFRNIDLARIYAANVRHLTNPYNYDLCICITGSMIQYDYFEMIDGIYQLYATCDDEETKYFVKPTVIKTINKIGYLVVNNGERVFDKNRGANLSNTFYNEALNSLFRIIKTPSIEPNISSINKDMYGICAQLKNSTAKIHICYNSNIMSINQKRKEEGLRAFRFSKEMDKYTTLYTFIEIDKCEPEWFEGIKQAEQILKMVTESMVANNDAIDSCTYSEIELLWPIPFEGSDDKRFMKKRG